MSVYEYTIHKALSKNLSPIVYQLKGKHHWAFVYAVFNCVVAIALRFMSKVKAAGTK